MSDTIGDYRLIDQIGEGGVGTVYLATPKVDKSFAKAGDLLALKTYKGENEAGTPERFQREFDYGKTLFHPHLVRCLDYLPGCEGCPACLVMEYVDGITLQAWIENFSPISGRLLLRFAEQLLNVIGYLHRQGVLHRDIKPQNIMVTSRFDLKVMDLGLLRVETGTRGAPLTSGFLGTLRNSPPEALDHARWSEATDLYSLGTVFYALLHGHEVFAHVTALPDLMNSIRSEVPRFDVELEMTGDPVVLRLTQLTRRLLSKSPEQRPQSCQEVWNDLAPVCSVLASAHPVEPMYGYIASAFAGLEGDARDASAFPASGVARLAKAFDLYLYQPRKATDPLLHEQVDPAEVYRRERARVLAADVLIVMANSASFGVGQVLEIVTGYSIPTLIVIRRDKKLARMVRGSPAHILDVIEYGEPDELERLLRTSIQAILKEIREWRSTIRPWISQSGIGPRLTEFRKKHATWNSAAAMAEHLGVSSRLVEAVERGEYDTIAPGLLRYLHAALGHPGE